MKEIKRLQESQETNTRTATSSTGIDDIDKIRAEVRTTPTDASNVLSRRTALYRWWRMLWHQGYDMNMSNYNAIWNRVLATQVSTLDAKLFALRDTGASATEPWQTQLGEHGFTADLVGNANDYFFAIE